MSEKFTQTEKVEYTCLVLIIKLTEHYQDYLLLHQLPNPLEINTLQGHGSKIFTDEDFNQNVEEIDIASRKNIEEIYQLFEIKII